MQGFNLPGTQSVNTAAFQDASSASAWLAKQPQANAPAMLAELLIQIEALNGYRMPPRERFKIIEVLRKSLFAVSAQCQLRYENKSLPLLSSEQMMLEWTQRLWRTATVAYLHCLQGCLDSDPGLDGEGARVAHRVLSCLRMEQLTAYLAWSEPGAGFWGAASLGLGGCREAGRDARSGSGQATRRDQRVDGQWPVLHGLAAASGRSV